jgi:hypothetical protein
MKKLFLIFSFMMLGFVMMAQQQTIAVGTTPNDNTGDPLRTAFIKCNDNFSELYGAMLSGACNGDKYAALRKGIKAVFLTPVIDRQLYFINLFKVATPHSPGNPYEYTLEITKIASPTATSGTLVSKYTVYAAALKTGYEMLNLQAQGSTGGATGFVIVDWGELGSNISYACDSWEEGGLFSIATSASATGGGSGGGSAIAEITAADSIMGNSPIYMLDPTGDISMYIAFIKNIEGSFTLKNISAHTVTLSSKEFLLIDGYTYIALAPKEYITIFPNVDKFEAVGKYTGSNP